MATTVTLDSSVEGGANAVSSKTLSLTTAGANRLAVVSISVMDGPATTTVSGGGLTWTQKIVKTGADGSNCQAEIWTAPVPTQATAATITITFSDGTHRLSAGMDTYFLTAGATSVPTINAVNGVNATLSGSNVTGTVTTTAANDHVIAYLMSGDALQINSPFVPTGFTATFAASWAGGGDGNSGLGGAIANANTPTPGAVSLPFGINTSFGGPSQAAVIGLALNGPPAPSVANANVNTTANTLTINFTVPGTTPMLPASGITGLTWKKNGTPFTVSGAAISGTAYTATPSVQIAPSDTVTFDYTPGNITDSASHAMLSVTGHSVTNNAVVPSAAAAPTVSDVTALSAVVTVPTLTTHALSENLQYSTDSGSTWSTDPLNTGLNGTQGTTTFIGAIPLMTYEFRWMSVNNAGATAGSASAPVTTPSLPRSLIFSTGKMTWYPTNNAPGGSVLLAGSPLTATRVNGSGLSVTGTAAHMVDGDTGTTGSINAHTAATTPGSSATDWAEVDLGAWYGVVDVKVLVSAGVGQTIKAWLADRTGLAPGASGTALIGTVTSATGTNTITAAANAEGVATGRYVLIESVDASAASLTIEEIEADVYPGIVIAFVQSFAFKETFKRAEAFEAAIINVSALDCQDSQAHVALTLEELDIRTQGLQLMLAAARSPRLGALISAVTGSQSAGSGVTIPVASTAKLTVGGLVAIGGAGVLGTNYEVCTVTSITDSTHFVTTTTLNHTSADNVYGVIQELSAGGVYQFPFMTCDFETQTTDGRKVTMVFPAVKPKGVDLAFKLADYAVNKLEVDCYEDAQGDRWLAYVDA